jgi:hypothetical protein
MLKPAWRHDLRDSVVRRIPPSVYDRLSVARALLTLGRLSRSTRPVVVGPWLGEVGFELLYWIPFLAWIRATRPAIAARAVVVSRGGVAAWYRPFSDRYIEILDYYPLDEFRARNTQRIVSQNGALKQWTVTRFDREILTQVRGAVPHPAPALLHPSLMYRLFLPFWVGRDSMARIRQHTRYQLFDRPGDGDLPADLPRDYLAVRFYFNASFPDTAENRAFVGRVVRSLTRRGNVVLLNPGLLFDDHRDHDIVGLDRVYTVAHLMEPHNNLGVQSAIVSHARAFVGTYGGLSYLAPFYGVPSVSFYSHRSRFVLQHLELAGSVFSALNGASWTAAHVRDFEGMMGASGALYSR